MTNYNYILITFFLLTICFATIHSYSKGSNIAIGNISKITPIGSKKEEKIEVKQQKIFFVGDLMLARNVERRLKNVGIESALSDFKELWQDNYVVANFEAAVPKIHTPTSDFTFRFSVNKEFLPGLKKAGITHASIANNHAFDFGIDGYLNTINSLNATDILTLGHPREINASSTQVITINDIKIGIMSINLITENFDITNLEEIVEELTLISDVQVIYIHWGNEYISQQAKYQQDFAKRLSLLGVDLVVGHHPHVIQGIEQINDTLVFYSLGNFLFDQYFSDEVQTGLVLSLFKDNNTISIDLIPVSSIDSRAQPKLLNGEKRLSILTEISKNSDPDLTEEILTGRLNLPFRLASSSKLVIMAR